LGLYAPFLTTMRAPLTTHQIVMGIMGFYTTLYLISKLFTGGKKAPEPGKRACVPTRALLYQPHVLVCGRTATHWL
jgi:hypothetical protein